MEIKGIGASKGKFKGIARLYIPSLILKPNDILVADFTSPAMSVQIANSSAVITKYGGMLSHAAIFCRELGIPCIVGVGDEINKISDGDVVLVDGNSGLIKKIKE